MWLSRGLGEAFVQFCAEAIGVGWGLRGAFYGLTWDGGLAALTQARDRGVDVRLVVHGRDRDTGTDDNDRTAAQAREAVERHHLTDNVTWRTAANKSNSAAPQIPHPGPPRSPGRRVDGLEQPHPWRVFRALECGPPSP